MKPTALGCYIFAGGFTLGVRKHFNVLAHFEGDKYGVATARHNFPKLPIYVGPENWPVDEYRGKVDFLYGNPPCAAWSVAGYTKTRGTDKWRTDPRVECTVRHFNLMKELRPKVWVWESVCQAYTKGIEFVRKLEADAIAEGYAVTYLLHNAQWLGLPQIRRRFFMLCHRIDLQIVAPNWQPGPTPLEVLQEVPEELREAVTKGNNWSISSFPPKVLRKVPPGTRLRSYWEVLHPEKTWKYRDDGTVIGRPSYGHYRLHPTEPSGAVVGYGLVHPTEHRFIGTKEYQSLSGFPVDFHFTPGGVSARASEIARGVCPPVAEWLAKMVAASIFASKDIRPSVREIDYRQPPQGFGDVQVKSLDPKRTVNAEATNDNAEKPARKPAPVLPPEKRPRAKPAKEPKPDDGRSGVYIRKLLRMECYTTAEIVALVHKNFPKSKATSADVSWHRDEMKKAGTPVRVVRELQEGTRKFA